MQAPCTVRARLLIFGTCLPKCCIRPEGAMQRHDGGERDFPRAKKMKPTIDVDMDWQDISSLLSGILLVSHVAKAMCDHGLRSSPHARFRSCARAGRCRNQQNWIGLRCVRVLHMRCAGLLQEPARAERASPYGGVPVRWLVHGSHRHA